MNWNYKLEKYVEIRLGATQTMTNVPDETPAQTQPNADRISWRIIDVSTEASSTDQGMYRCRSLYAEPTDLESRRGEVAGMSRDWCWEALRVAVGAV